MLVCLAGMLVLNAPLMAKERVRVATLTQPEEVTWHAVPLEINEQINQIDAAFSKFKHDFDNIRQAVRKQTGKVYFEHAINIENGTVVITASDAWYALPDTHRKISLRSLFLKWSIARHHAASAKLIIQDVRGRRQLIRSR